ncbi:MAG: hypothetical protein NZ929_03535 [Aigarchaeota archaeon]|nr:hypothetical protein [Aigarchaeota archaeon]MDW7986498.1 hypothetical protein [Nitrososphaerota archaeon]
MERRYYRLGEDKDKMKIYRDSMSREAMLFIRSYIRNDVRDFVEV